MHLSEFDATIKALMHLFSKIVFRRPSEADSYSFPINQVSVAKVIESLRWSLSSKEVIWTTSGILHRRSYDAAPLSVVLLADNTGIAIVEPYEESKRDNALILNADGTVRFRMKVPQVLRGSAWFSQMYYLEDKLFAFIFADGLDVRCEVDEQSGALGEQIESR